MPDPKLDSNFRQADLERHMMAWHGKSFSSRNRELTVLAIEAFKKSKANN